MRFGRGSAGHSSKGQMTRIKQIIVRRPGRYRQSHGKLIKKGANQIPRQVPDRVSIFRGRLFPQSRPHLVCGANGTALSVLMAWQIPR